MAPIRARFPEFRFVVVLTLTVTIIAVLVQVAAHFFGSTGGVLVGLGVAGLATKVFEALERTLRVPQHLEVSWTPPPWLWSAVAGILIVQASDVPAEIVGTAIRLLHGGELGCSTSTFVAIAAADFAGFAACGYVAGRITPSRATIAVALGLVILFILTLTDITGFSEQKISQIAKCLGQVGDAEDVYSFKFGAIAGLAPRAFLGLYGAALGARHRAASGAKVVGGKGAA